MPDALPWFPLHVSRFLGSRRVRRMDSRQVGIYMLLLIEQWDSGALPDDPEELAFLAKTEDDPEAVMEVVRKCFELTDAGWVNDVLEEIRAEQEQKAADASAKGRKAAEARWGKRKKSGRNASAVPEHATDAEAMPEHPNSAPAVPEHARAMREQGKRMPVEEEERKSRRTASASNEAGLRPPVEKSTEVGPRDPGWSEIMGAIRTTAGLDRLDEEDIARSGSIARAWLDERGMDPPDVVRAIEGWRDLTDRGLTWIAPGEPFSLRALNGTGTRVHHHSGEVLTRPALDVALEAVSDPRTTDAWSMITELAQAMKMPKAPDYGPRKTRSA